MNIQQALQIGLVAYLASLGHHPAYEKGDKVWYHSPFRTDRVKEAIRGDYDAHIVLFKCGDQWAAIGEDADRLFELFGWQTAFVAEGTDEVISWIYVTEDGMEVLKDSPYTIKVLNIGKVSVTTNSYLECVVAHAQQFADSKRLVIRTADNAQKKLNTSLQIISYTLACQKRVERRGLPLRR